MSSTIVVGTGILTVKKLIEQGQLGDVKVFESHFDRYRPVVRQRWREQAQEGGGILFDLAPTYWIKP